MAKRIGIVGLGRMGHAIASRLLSQGFEVVIYNRTDSRMTDLLAAGAKRASCPADAAVPGGLLLSSLTDEQALLDVCGGPSGVLRDFAGGIHLSTSTLSPAAASGLARQHADAGATYISAPMQGRPAMAEAGQLVAWVSGMCDATRTNEVLSAIASRTIWLGQDVRQAPAAKLALNMLMNANIALFAEAYAYVSSYGVKEDSFGCGLTDTAFSAPLFKAIAARLVVPDDAATGSDVRVSRKDSDLLVASSDGLPLTLPLAAQLARVYRDAEERGWGHLDPVSIRRLLTDSPRENM